MPLDRFSAQASLYARYRIDYPEELYDWLLARVPGRERAWDCATGNGQVAQVLARHFRRVEATDLSAAQLAQAPALPNVVYQTSPAEETPFSAAFFDLVTVAQALHWFNQAAFNEEVRRVLQPGGVVAEWGYGLVHLGPDLDPLLRHFHDHTLRPYWDDNRWHVLDEYARLPFPFEAVEHARFFVERQWSAEWMLNYLRTWSGVVKYQQQRGHDPVSEVANELTERWGLQERTVQFPVFARVGRV